MPARPFALTAVLGGTPPDIAKVSDFANSAGFRHHQHPFVDWIHDDGQLALFLFLNRLAHPRGRPLLPRQGGGGHLRR